MFSYVNFLILIFFLIKFVFILEQKQSDNNRNSSEDPNKNNDDKKLIGYGLVWISLGYLIITAISILFPPANKPDILRYVSWNEFYHQMLAKGEVELIVVKPDLDLVTIYLYDGAIIRGKPAPYRSYHMNIVNVGSFEAKLRQAENDLGVKSDQSVHLVFERNQEGAWIVIFSLLILAVFVSLLIKSSTITKSPLNTNLFVSFSLKTNCILLKVLFNYIPSRICVEQNSLSLIH